MMLFCKKNNHKLIIITHYPPTKKVLEILMNEGMGYRDALEHFHFNIVDGSLGDLTPIFCDDLIFE
jgi:hypothetical protein